VETLVIHASAPNDSLVRDFESSRGARIEHQFGTRGSEVQILSPRPYLVDSVDSILAVLPSF
jgi:hypothetical protein